MGLENRDPRSANGGRTPCDSGKHIHFKERAVQQFTESMGPEEKACCGEYAGEELEVRGGSLSTIKKKHNSLVLVAHERMLEDKRKHQEVKLQECLEHTTNRDGDDVRTCRIFLGD